MAFFRISKKKILAGVDQQILDSKMELDELFHEVPEYPGKEADMKNLKSRLIELIDLKKNCERLLY